MKTLLSIAAILAAGLTTVQETQASGAGKGRTHMTSGSHHSQPSHVYNSSFRGWSNRYFNSRYGCYFYTCPTSFCQYYWYAPGCCYYPVSYIAQYPPITVQPVAVATAPVIQVTNTNINGGGGPVPVGPGPMPGLSK